MEEQNRREKEKKIEGRFYRECVLPFCVAQRVAKQKLFDMGRAQGIQDTCFGPTHRGSGPYHHVEAAVD